MRIVIALFLTLAALTACNPAYKRPNSPDAASLRFLAAKENIGRSVVAVYAHDGEGCGGAKKLKYIGRGVSFGGTDFSDSDIGMPKDPLRVYERGQYFETTVLSGRPFQFTAVAALGNRICHVTGSFLPTNGALYEITYLADGLSCRVAIDHIDSSVSGFVRTRESSMRQRQTPCTFFWN